MHEGAHPHVPTHVASIAVGDNGVDPLVDGNPLGVARISGVAPGAYLAVYKACWLFGVCSDVDVVAAIDAAVANGVINLSLTGSAAGVPSAPRPNGVRVEQHVQRHAAALRDLALHLELLRRQRCAAR
jgi:hypothetical protein